MFQTEYEFCLPKGYVDASGTLHREGIMRLATAADEILPLKDPRVQANESYLVVILLSRVITKLGTLSSVNPKVVEEIFAEDLAYLQGFYNQINGNGQATMKAVCPKCDHAFEVELGNTGGF
jgi:hypothetical protein